MMMSESPRVDGKPFLDCDMVIESRRYRGDDVALRTQQEVDDFGRNQYHAVDSNLLICGENIQHIESLSSIMIVTGDLCVSWCKGLRSLNGLEGLLEVGGELQLLALLSISDLSGLHFLQRVWGDVDIGMHASLESVWGLESLIEVKGDVKLNANWALTTLVGLHRLKEIGGKLSMSHNEKLTSLVGLSELRSIGGAVDINMDNIWDGSLWGLEELKEVGGTLKIIGVTYDIRLGGIDKLGPPVYGTNIMVVNNSNLDRLNGLQSLVKVGRCVLSDDGSLEPAFNKSIKNGVPKEYM